MKNLPTRDDFAHEYPNIGYRRQEYLIALEEWAKEANEKLKKYDVDITKEKLNNFEEASRPLIKWLCENEHPHVTAIITPTSCELLEGKCSNPKIYDYVVD